MTNSLVTQNNYEILDQSAAASQVTAVEQTKIRKFLLTGIFIMTVFVAGGFYWAVNAKLNGAVVAPASFVVEGNRKTVQHLEGGIVSELLVKNGDFVRANQILVRMDGTDNDVDLSVLGGQFAELKAG